MATMAGGHGDRMAVAQVGTQERRLTPYPNSLFLARSYRVGLGGRNLLSTCIEPPADANASSATNELLMRSVLHLLPVLALLAGACRGLAPPDVGGRRRRPIRSLQPAKRVVIPVDRVTRVARSGHRQPGATRRRLQRRGLWVIAATILMSTTLTTSWDAPDAVLEFTAGTSVAGRNRLALQDVVEGSRLWRLALHARLARHQAALSRLDAWAVLADAVHRRDGCGSSACSIPSCSTWTSTITCRS